MASSARSHHTQPCLADWPTVKMKQRGTCENAPPGIRHRETTRDERIRVISMRDDTGMSWTAIGKCLEINRGSAQWVDNFNATLINIATISTWLRQYLQKSKGVWYPIESPANWLPSNFRRCWETAICRPSHARRTNETPDLGSDMHGNGNGVGGNMGKSGRYRGFGSLLASESCLGFYDIPQERLDSLIRNMFDRLQAVIDAKGGATPYWSYYYVWFRRP